MSLGDQKQAVESRNSNVSADTYRNAPKHVKVLGAIIIQHWVVLTDISLHSRILPIFELGSGYVWKCFSSVYEMFPKSALFHANSNNIPRCKFWSLFNLWSPHWKVRRPCLLCLNSAYLFLFLPRFYWQIYMLIGTFGRSEKGEMLVVGGKIMLNRLTFRWLQLGLFDTLSVV